MIVFLRLQDSYPFETVITPIVLGDHSQLVDAFVGEDEDRRIKLVATFDRWASLGTHQFTAHLKNLGVDVTNKCRIFLMLTHLRAHAHTNTHAHIYAHTHMLTHTHTHIYIYIYIHAPGEAEFIHSSGYKLAKLNQRTLGRMTTNLVKKYGLNEEEACPLLLAYRERGFLRHQTREFIVNKAVDEQTWADNVESVVR